MTTAFARAIEGIPVVASAGDRDTLYSAPTLDQRVQLRSTGELQRWSGAAWITDLAIAIGLPAESRVAPTATAYVENNKEYNVRDYYLAGVTTSWNAAINAAITFANAAGGGRVRVPAGAYAMANVQITLLSNVRVVGDGREVTTFTWNYPGGIGIYAQNRTNVHVEGIAFVGPIAMGLVFDGCTKATSRRNSFTGCTSSTHATGYAAGVVAWVTDDFTADDNLCFGNGYTGAGLSYDILYNGNGNNTGSLRCRITRNKCLSTGVQTNIGVYDGLTGEVSDNTFTGAICGAGNNNGYGIIFYRTTAMTGPMGHFRIVRNVGSNTQGTGIYCQAASHLIVSENDLTSCCSVQDDSTLAAGGISFSNCFNVICKGNIIKDSGRAGIVVAGLPAFMVQPTDGRPAGCEGYVIEGNEIDGVTQGTRPTGILIRGPLDRSQIVNNTIRGAFCGIGTLPAAPGRTTSNAVGVGDGATANGSPNIVSVLAQFSAHDLGVCVFGAGIPDNAYILSVTDASHAVLSANATATSATVVFTIGGITDSTIDLNTIEGTTGGRAIDLFGAYRSSVSDNLSYGAAKDGMALDYGYQNKIHGNQNFDGGTLTTNIYIGLYLVNQREADVDGGRSVNTGAVGFKWGVYMGSDCPKSRIFNFRASGCLTANYSIDPAVLWGTNNYDASSPFPLYPTLAKQRAVLAGAASSTVSLLLGDSGTYGEVGTLRGGGDPYMADNASHSLTADLWHQSGAATSKLTILRVNGDIEFYHAVNGKADGTFAAFWGTPTHAFTASGQIKLNGTIIVTPTQLTGTLTTAAQANVTSLGALTALTTGGTLQHTGAALGFFNKAAVAQPAAIAAPSAPSAAYSQAEATSMKTAVDAIRVALTALGLTL